MYTMISTKTHILKMYLFGHAESSCSVGFSLGVASRGYSPVAVHEFLIAVASLVVRHGLVVGMSCSTCAQQLWLVGSRARAQSWHTDIVAPWHVGSSWTKDQTCVSCIGR